MTVALRTEPTVTRACRWHRWGPAKIRQRDGVWCNGKTGDMHRGRILVQARRCTKCAVVQVTEAWPGGKRRTVLR